MPSLCRRFTVQWEGLSLRPARPVWPVRTDTFYILVIRVSVVRTGRDQGRLSWQPLSYQAKPEMSPDGTKLPNQDVRPNGRDRG
jgi:hypothetical protein